MRITREILLKLARDTAETRARRHRDIVCIFLTGSLLGDSPLLGGTTDIDLMVIHNGEPAMPREILAASDEISLDIGHFSQSAFAQPRRLRADPWLGPYLCGNPLVLYDQQHWFEFTQASACSQFYQPEYVMQRARPQEEEARRIWVELHMASEVNTGSVIRFLLMMQRAGNALALLSGAPLPERRFFLSLEERAKAVNRPGLAGGLADLMGGADRATLDWDAWIPGWTAALTAVGKQEDCPPKLLPARHSYYERAVKALAEEHPNAALWILLRTWTEAICRLPGDPALREPWDACREALGLGTEGFAQRLSDADSYLDTLEETLDNWAQANGVGE